MALSFSLKKSLAGLVILSALTCAAALCPGNPEPVSTPEQMARELCQIQIQGALKGKRVNNQIICNRDDAVLLDAPLPSHVCDQNDTLFQQYLASISSNRIKINIGKVHACQDLKRKDPKRAWKTLFEWMADSIDRGKTEPCATMVQGQQAEGENCLADDECQGTLVCRQDDNDKSKMICRAPKGGACTPANPSNCGKDEGCDRDNNVCVLLSQTARTLQTKFKPDGEFCTSTEECLFCYKCRGTPKKCQPSAKLGEMCEKHEDCNQDLYCKDNVCVGRPKNGEACTQSPPFVPCLEGNDCLATKGGTQKCITTAAIGAMCADLIGPFCTVGSSCVEVAGGKKICIERGKLEAPCDGDTDCDTWEGIRSSFGEDSFPSPSLFCSPKEDGTRTCKLRLKAGQDCKKNSQCEIGTRCKNDHCTASTSGSPCKDDSECDSLECTDDKCEAPKTPSCNNFNPSTYLFFAMILPILRLRRRR